MLVLLLKLADCKNLSAGIAATAASIADLTNAGVVVSTSLVFCG